MVEGSSPSPVNCDKLVHNHPLRPTLPYRTPAARANKLESSGSEVEMTNHPGTVSRIVDSSEIQGSRYRHARVGDRRSISRLILDDTKIGNAGLRGTEKSSRVFWYYPYSVRR